MQYTPPDSSASPSSKSPLIHSLHNTWNPTIKVALVPSAHQENALDQFTALHAILAANIEPVFHQNLFDRARSGITGQQINLISWYNYAAYANQLLDTFSLQDGEIPEETSPIKLLRPVPLTYAAATGSPVEHISTVPCNNYTTSILLLSPLSLLMI